MRKGIFAGRLGKDAELRYSRAGKAVCGFPLAVDVRQGDQKSTLWVDCAIWGERAEKLAPYLKKGDSVTVIGDVGARAYQAAQGEPRGEITVTVWDITLQGSASHQDAAERPLRDERPAPRGAERSQPPEQPDPDDDIPF